MNIEFKHPSDVSKAAMTSALSSLGYSYTLKEINNGYGLKYILDNGSAIVMYFSKGKSSSIIAEKMPDDMAITLIDRLQEFAAKCLKIECVAPITPQKSGVKTSKAPAHLHIEFNGNTSRQELAIPAFSRHIGSDESGKGDFFGGLTVSAVFVTAEQESRLRLAGVRDSKSLSDDKILVIHDSIIEIVGVGSVSSITLSPTEYNEYYPRYRANVNYLLARAHGKVLSNLITRHDCHDIVVDQFCSEDYMKKALAVNCNDCNLLLTPRAERDIAVAAASIIARANYVKQMDSLSIKAGFELAKGANSIVVEQAKRLVKTQGVNCLKDYVKMHFKTIDQV